MGLLGLVAGAGALALVVNSQEVHAVREELVARFDQQLQQQREQYATSLSQDSSRFNQEWNQKLNDAVARVNADTESALARHRQEAEVAAGEILQAKSDWIALQQDFRKQSQALLAAAELPKDGAASTSSVAGLAEPSLSAQQVLRPVLPADNRLLVLRNDGAHEAAIRRVVFRATDRFQVRDMNVASKIPSSTALLIEFLPEDNRSAMADHHNLYVRDYADDLVVPGKADAAVQLIIRNAEHAGWGLIGDLTIEYASGKQLEIGGVSAVFEPGSADRI